MAAQILAFAATSRARSATSESEPPAEARRAASSATNPSAIDAMPESTTSTCPPNRSAASLASWWAELIVAATVTHTISSCPARRYASRKSPGDGVEVVAVAERVTRRWYRSSGAMSTPSR